MAARFRLDLDFAPDRCEYSIGDGLLTELGPKTARLVTSPVCALVTDSHLAETPHVAAAEGSLRRAGLAPRTIVVAAGETSKSVETASRLWNEFAAAGLAADGAVIALGGGMVGDLAGFCAATWMRGVTLVQVPTTLLGMCDSAVGGKTALDLAAGKNLVGAFHHARFVLADLVTLDTLSAREFRSGLAEVVKCALLLDRGSLTHLHDSAPALVARDRAEVAQAVRLAVEVKADHVRADVNERSGRRVLLNLGHTTAHAIEAEAGYAGVLHGEAVAAGLVVAARIGCARGLCGDDLVTATQATLGALGLPTSSPPALDAARLVARTLLDKKRRGGRRRMVLPHGRGGAGVYEVDDAEYLAALVR
jgi:3-dehydroquinate synthase